MLSRRLQLEEKDGPIERDTQHLRAGGGAPGRRLNSSRAGVKRIDSLFQVRQALCRAQGFRINGDQLQSICAETFEELLAAGEDHDLYMLCGVREDVEHPLHPLIVGENERIV